MNLQIPQLVMQSKEFLKTLYIFVCNSRIIGEDVPLCGQPNLIRDMIIYVKQSTPTFQSQIIRNLIREQRILGSIIVNLNNWIQIRMFIVEHLYYGHKLIKFNHIM